MFGDVFHKSPDTIPYKTTKSSKFLGLWKIIGKNRPIFKKNLKSQYLKNTLFDSTHGGNEQET